MVWVLSFKMQTHSTFISWSDGYIKNGLLGENFSEWWLTRLIECNNCYHDHTQSPAFVFWRYQFFQRHSLVSRLWSSFSSKLWVLIRVKNVLMQIISYLLFNCSAMKNFKFNFFIGKIALQWSTSLLQHHLILGFWYIYW